MQLIGMLDSPYVRRTAISMRRLNVAFELRQVSVFRHMDAFGAINPVVKAPTLVCDDGGIIMDSNLILDYVEALAGRSLLPRDVDERRVVLTHVGYGLAVADKAVQIEYERKRPETERSPAWMERITAQLRAACAFLDDSLQDGRRTAAASPSQADITIAVAWSFAQLLVADVVSRTAFPALDAFTHHHERHGDFLATPLA